MTHAENNLKKFLEDGILQEAEHETLCSKIAKALSLPRYRTDTAVIIRLSRKVPRDYGHRDFWAEPDTVAAIIRNGKVITVLLTDSPGASKEALRVRELFR